MTARSLPLSLLPTLIACGGGGASAGQDIQDVALSLDLAAHTGEAVLRVQPGAEGVALDVSGLTLTSVEQDGRRVRARSRDGWLALPAEGPTELRVRYDFADRSVGTFDGWMPALGVSFLWPSACGNLYPCNPDTADGLTFSLALSGVDPGLVAVAPEQIPGEAPPYMLGFAVGDYTTLELGRTTAGTHLQAWFLDGEDGRADAQAGTAHLVEAWDFFERTYGPYAFGDEAGTVEVDWGADSWGGMEHHPFFHVARFDFGHEEPQVHEAAHGWFGDGVRLACWEDFVLSEGTTTYVTARALEAIDGPNLWPMYVDDYLTPICTGQDTNTVVWPEGCGTLDFESSPLWSLAPYMKGACFYEEVGDLIGPEALDAAIATFYAEHMGQAAHMDEMLETILAASEPAQRAAIEGYAQDWLRTRACPEDYARRCRSHDP